MEKQDLSNALDMLKKMLEMKDELGKLQQKYSDSKDSHNDDDQKIADDIQNDYLKFMDWCFGEDFDKLKRTESITRWSIMHPNIPVPRSLLVDLRTNDMHVTGLMIDAFPAYLEYKKSET